MHDTCGLSIIIWATLAPFFLYWVIGTFFFDATGKTRIRCVTVVCRVDTNRDVWNGTNWNKLNDEKTASSY